VTAKAAPSRDVLSGGRSELGLGGAAEWAGRDPGSIRRIINVQGVIGERPAPSRSGLPVGYLAGETLAGLADWWVETLAGFVDDGFDTLVFWPRGPRAGPDRVARRRGGTVRPPAGLICQSDPPSLR
jgi:hypothetical protein